MRGRPVLVLLVGVLVVAIGIGFYLTRQRPLSAEEALTVCRQQQSAMSRDLGSCLRSQIYPRPSPTTWVVVLLPIGFGTVAVALITLTARRNPPRLCRRCGVILASDDTACPSCATPVPA